MPVKKEFWKPPIAFSIVSHLIQIGKQHWFDMTCAGHYPGTDRPGVPFEVSRCCNFRLGNVLADGTQNNNDAGSRLERLKRSIECKKQIGGNFLSFP